VLGAGGDADGLVAFLRGGLPLWLRTRASTVSVPKTAPEMGPRGNTGSDPERTELVRLMANIICQHLSEQAA
jgi:hypothetical protein